MRRSRILGIAFVVVTTGILSGGAAVVADAASAAQPPAASARVAAAPAPAAVPAKPATPAKLAAPAKPATPAKPAASPGVPCAATVRACIDLTHNRAWLLRGGVVQYGPIPITSGRAGYRTPVGTFHVLSRERLHLSREFDDAPMPYSVFFFPGDAFHQGSLSVPSHGCIHLSRAAAITVFNSLRVGDTVQAVR